MANTNLKMTVTADTKQATQSLGSVVTSIAQTTLSVTSITMAAKQLLSTCKELMDLSSQETLAQERLRSVLLAAGTAAGVTTSKMLKLADSLSDLTGIEEQSIYSAERILVAFGTLNEEGLERTLQLSADVAMAMGTDISSAAQKLGQVLATPTQGLDGLKEIGITFTAQEQEQIKTVYEANGAYEAQALILDKVASTYSGSAQRIGESAANLTTKISESFGDIKTTLGDMLNLALNPFLEALKEATSAVSNFFDSWLSGINLVRQTNQMKKIAAEGVTSNTIEEENSTSTNASATTTASSSSATTTAASSTSSGKTFLSSYGAQSTTYQIAQLKAAINEAQALRDSMVYSISESGTIMYKNSVKKEFGITNTKEADVIYSALGEIIENLQSKIDTLNGTDTTISDILNSYGTLSDKFNEDQTAAKIAEIKSALDSLAEGDSAKVYLQEIYDSLTAVAEDTTVSDILSSLGSYSESYQSDQLDEQINNVKAALDSLADGDPAKTYLQEIYDAMTAVEEESYSLKDALTDIGSALLDTFSSVATSLAEIWSNQADALEENMKEQEEAGELTVAEREKMQEEIDNLNRKAFETNKANSIADATISLANTIIGIIEQTKGNAVAAGILTALATASWGAQVASISSQQYTAMATGGIVTGPTHALIGEAGPEAIIPLKDKRAQEYLGSGANPVQINITIEGNADEEVVFNAIERAQKTGMLPSWRYAN